MIKYTAALYEEYQQASRYAKFRYKFGVYLQILSFILLLFLLYYTVTNIEEMTTNPIDYAEKKLGVMCYYPIVADPWIPYNGNIGDIRSTERE